MTPSREIRVNSMSLRTALLLGFFVGIVEGAVGADQFELSEDRRVLVTILSFGHEGLKRWELLQGAGGGALVGIQVEELAGLGPLEDRVAEPGRPRLRKLLEDRAHERRVRVLAAGLHGVGNDRLTHR